MRRAAALAALLLAVACNRAPPPPAQPNAAASSNGVRAKLRTMNESARDAVFIRAIRDAAQTCQHVTGSTYQREVGALSLWTARCDDGGAWAIYIGDDGGAQVANCGEAGRDGKPACGAPAG